MLNKPGEVNCSTLSFEAVIVLFIYEYRKKLNNTLNMGFAIGFFSPAIRFHGILGCVMLCGALLTTLLLSSRKEYKQAKVAHMGKDVYSHAVCTYSI